MVQRWWIITKKARTGPDIIIIIDKDRAIHFQALTG